MSYGLRLPKLQLSGLDKVKSDSKLQLMANQQPASKGRGGGDAPSPSPNKLSPPSKYLDTSNNSVDAFSEFSSKYTGSTAPPHLNRDRSWYSKRVRRRLVYKNGECNISHVNIKKRRQRYLADIFTTLVDIKWRWNLLIFVLAFTLSWLLFGLIWWLICFSHGDFNEENRKAGANWDPCVHEVYDFTTALLFSIETQHTIGYGSRQTAPNCPEAILIMMFQSCFGVIIQALMTGLVFAKLSRPKKRAETLMFSKNAVVCKRDGQLCLLFRVGDMRKSHIVEAHVRALLIKKRVTQEGEVLPLYQYEVKIGDEEGANQLFLVWPVIIEHKIDKGSPFWDITPEDLHKEQFELIIILEGIVESTGMTTQARTSYLPGEILWGNRFERLVTFQRENGEYLIDYSRFHATIPIDIPQCSARELSERKRKNKGMVGSRETDNEEEDEEEDLDSTSMDSTTRDESRPPTPLIMKQNGLSQTAFDLGSVDSVSRDMDTYQFVGNL